MNRLLNKFLLANFGFVAGLGVSVMSNLLWVKSEMIDVFGIIINKAADYDVIMVKPDFYVAYLIIVGFLTAGMYFFQNDKVK